MVLKKLDILYNHIGCNVNRNGAVVISRVSFILIYVVVQLYPWCKFYIPLFFGMLMYDSDFKQKKVNFEPRIKLNHNIYSYKEGM